MTAPLLSIRDLTIAFGTNDATRRISFDIAPGQTVALVGESGSGKSVTALSVLKLLPASAKLTGQILFKGKDLVTVAPSELRAVRGNDISMIFQEPMSSLNPVHTIERQIGEVLAIHRGLRATAARKRTLELLDAVGIPDPASRLSSYPHQLSGGQRQRVMIAMALANEPDLL
ncbi:MAG: transporter ATP-binding protein, partial [Devosia sp.]|nr:transporter ATP-binding protein [Devosia sp.]